MSTSQYYCTCDSGKNKAVEGHTKMKLTETDNEGICIHCGYYALKCKGQPADYKGTKYQTAAKKKQCDANYYRKTCGSKDYSTVYDSSYITEMGLIR